MKKTGVTLNDVKLVYSGPELALWELVMGEQIHVGGMSSSLKLASAAGLKEGMHGVDLCCCLGAGMRLLARQFGVKMCGVDATDHVIQIARERASQSDVAELLEFRLGDVIAIPASACEFDFVWGEDAWCYVSDKDKLIAEAARVLKPGGTIAFTDWIFGPAGMSDDEATRICAFMKFPYLESGEGYRELLLKHGFEIVEAVDLTPEFAKYCDLYIDMLTMQHTSDALAILGNDMEMFSAIGGEMNFMRTLAHAGKMGRGRFVAKKRQ